MKEKYKHIDNVTIKEVQDLIKIAYESGFESDDGFLLAVGLKY